MMLLLILIFASTKDELLGSQQFLHDDVLNFISQPFPSRNVGLIKSALTFNQYDPELEENDGLDVKLRVQLINVGICGKWLLDDRLSRLYKAEMYLAAFQYHYDNIGNRMEQKCTLLENELYQNLNAKGQFTKDLLLRSFKEIDFWTIFRISQFSRDFQVNFEYDIFTLPKIMLTEALLNRIEEFMPIWSDSKFNTDRLPRLKSLIEKKEYAKARAFILNPDRGLKGRLSKNLDKCNLRAACQTLTAFTSKLKAVDFLKKLKDHNPELVRDLNDKLQTLCFCGGEDCKISKTKCCNQLLHPSCSLKNELRYNRCPYCRTKTPNTDDRDVLETESDPNQDASTDTE